MQQNVKSELNQAEETEVAHKKNELFGELLNGGPIQDLVVRKLRSPVQLILTNKDGADFAANCYGGICLHIIKAALAINKPALFSRVLTKDQVEKVQQTYPLQLQMMKSVIEKIDNAKRYDQLENLTDNNTLNTLL